MNARRRIFAELRVAGRPLTTAELSRALDLHRPTVANTCSLLETEGIVSRPLGTRKGYAACASMLDAYKWATLVAAHAEGRP